MPKGGPDGGTGGDGGNVYFLSDKNLNTLAFFRYHPINKAKKGSHGEGGNRRGKNGIDVILKVPVGTVVKEKESQKILYDFVKDDQKFLAAEGGRGGRGNASFVTSTRQSPKFREEGKPGVEIELTLELKLIADVGLIGFPNVGKSTLISKISAARPEIADYPFTTLVPNLGVVDVGDPARMQRYTSLRRETRFGHACGRGDLKPYGILAPRVAECRQWPTAFMNLEYLVFRRPFPGRRVGVPRRVAVRQEYVAPIHVGKEIERVGVFLA